jgi:hypothetical protein
MTGVLRPESDLVGYGMQKAVIGRARMSLYGPKHQFAALWVLSGM